MGTRTLGIIPFSPEYARGRLFSTPELDRDGVLQPWRALAGSLRANGWRVDTADLLDDVPVGVWLHLDAHQPPPPNVPAERTILMMFEPEVVAPYWYRRMRDAAPPFAAIFTHDLNLVARGRPFSYLYIPHSPPPSLLPRARTERLVMINARKYPRSRRGELYSERERVAQWFADHDAGISVYGSGWSDSDWLRHPWFALRTRSLRRVARGPVASKFDVLAQARFAVCFENMRSPGYLSEKLFDCLACGCVPVYYGNPEIAKAVPADAFVDYGMVQGPEDLNHQLEAIGGAAETRMREAGAQFLTTEDYRRFSIPAFVGTLTSQVTAIVDG